MLSRQKRHTNKIQLNRHLLLDTGGDETVLVSGQYTIGELALLVKRHYRTSVNRHYF